VTSIVPVLVSVVPLVVAARMLTLTSLDAKPRLELKAPPQADV